MVASVVRWLGHRRPFARAARRMVPHLDRAAFRVSGRTVAGALLPTLMLETVGRRSAARRRVPLLFVRDGDTFVVAATGFGQRAHPEWSANLLAHPRATIDAGRGPVAVRARLAIAEERARLWSRLRELWPAYETYAAWAVDRDVRVFLLEPDDQEAAPA